MFPGRPGETSRVPPRLQEELTGMISKKNRHLLTLQTLILRCRNYYSHCLLLKYHTDFISQHSEAEREHVMELTLMGVRAKTGRD